MTEILYEMSPFLALVSFFKILELQIFMYLSFSVVPNEGDEMNVVYLSRRLML
jgi:hypothetical protein